MQTQSSPELVAGWLDLQKKRRDHPELYSLRSTGLRGLDAVLGGGIEFGQFVIVGGAQKMGKSMLLQHIAQTFAAHNDAFLFLSAEITNMSMATRLFSNATGIPKDKIRRIQLDNQDWLTLEQAGETIGGYPGYWNYGFSTLEDIRKVRHTIKKEKGINIRVVMAENFQLMEGKGNNRVSQLEAISRGFKRMCVEEQEPMIMILASQLNRASIRGHMVDANSFLGTGALERDMDIGIIIHEIKDEANGNAVIPNLRRLTVVGSRDTDVGFCDIVFRGETATIRDRVKDKVAVSMDYWRS